MAQQPPFETPTMNDILRRFLAQRYVASEISESKHRLISQVCVVFLRFEKIALKICVAWNFSFDSNVSVFAILWSFLALSSRSTSSWLKSRFPVSAR
jgi:hypothetical protein